MTSKQVTNLVIVAGLGALVWVLWPKAPKPAAVPRPPPQMAATQMPEDNAPPQIEAAGDAPNQTAIAAALLAALNPIVFTGSARVRLGDHTTDAEVTLNANQATSIPVGNDVSLTITPSVMSNGGIRYFFSIEGGNPAKGTPVTTLVAPGVITTPAGGSGFGLDLGEVGPAGSLQFAFTAKPGGKP